jgi:hypothetical protein
VAGAALAAAVADLGDRGHVQGVVEAPVAAPGQPKIFRLPEDTSIGAVPLQAAKWSRPGKRETSRTLPITVAATTGPTPNRPARLVPDARTAA